MAIELFYPIVLKAPEMLLSEFRLKIDLIINFNLKFFPTLIKLWLVTLGAAKKNERIKDNWH